MEKRSGEGNASAKDFKYNWMMDWRQQPKIDLDGEEWFLA